jgi:hypothetical protein
MTAIIEANPALATSPETLGKLFRAQAELLKLPQIDVHTDHVLHGGIYTRTIHMKPGTYVMGAHYKVSTTVILSGSLWAYVGQGWKQFSGYNVIPASAGRKQLFATPYENTEDAVITMSFRTDAKTVEQAENEMTDEAELLMSRQSDGDTVTITGE